ncbi:hypothetical protein TEQG_01577 [Trichophyton equinum CBS 127.97]|uniref:Uncharacterized protein n=1 Tax=Trichophyton equinum (strain ATCC MYA-4606 / CBS 127.97) TaxID=559882 RepID=F2PLH8_TRIEC|nr:hypothetical protein TEQG_01577 [Trichophyton equinum CBS 127.97]
MGTPCVRAMAPVSPYGFGFATRMIAWSGLSSFATGERLSDRPLGRANCFHARSLARLSAYAEKRLPSACCRASHRPQTPYPGKRSHLATTSGFKPQASPDANSCD